MIPFDCVSKLALHLPRLALNIIRLDVFPIAFVTFVAAFASSGIWSRGP